MPSEENEKYRELFLWSADPRGLVDESAHLFPLPSGI